LEAVIEAVTKAVTKRPKDRLLGRRHNCNNWAKATRKPRRGPGEGPSLKGPEPPRLRLEGGKNQSYTNHIPNIHVAFLVYRTIVPSIEPAI